MGWIPGWGRSEYFRSTTLVCGSNRDLVSLENPTPAQAADPDLLIVYKKKKKKIEDYFADWCLSVNINKTKVIVFNEAGQIIKSNFTFQKETIECVSSYRYLGLYFSASGSFSYAESKLYKKGLKGYFKLCKNILKLEWAVDGAPSQIPN